jgi:hypothetical protein
LPRRNFSLRRHPGLAARRLVYSQGEPHAPEELLPLVYDELRKLAATRLAGEAPHGKRTSIAGKPKEFGEEVHVPAGPLALDLE